MCNETEEMVNLLHCQETYIALCFILDETHEGLHKGEIQTSATLN